MRKAYKWTVVLLALAGPLLAADVTIDLATETPGTAVSVPIDVRDQESVRIDIIHKVPTARYNIVLARRTLPISPLEAEELGAPGAGGVRQSVTCRTIIESYDALIKETDESKIPATKAALERALAAKNWRTCEDPDAGIIFDPSPEALLASTEKQVSTTLSVGEQLVVTITRISPEPTKTWTVTYDAGPRGKWITSYGFGFAKNGDKTYHLVPSGDKFVIAEAENRSELDAVPQVFFSWMSRTDEARDFPIRFGAGVGYDEAPVLSLGLIGTYNSNLSITAGVMAQRQKRLVGRYQPGQELAENLGEDQLHETVIRPNLFVGVSFRFDRSPFQRTRAGDAPAEEEDAEEAAPTEEDKQPDSTAQH